jgi:glucose/arabinose dehydrogenase
MSSARTDGPWHFVRTRVFAVLVTLAAMAVIVVVASPDARRSLKRLPGSITGTAASAPGLSLVRLVPVATGFVQITDIQFVPGSPRSMVVLEKTGKARWVTLPDLAANAPATAGTSHTLFEVAVKTRSELGLLGLAFHPDFAKNGLLYVHYNPDAGDVRTRIAEFHVAPDRAHKERAVERRTLLEVAQPYSNHNGGQIAFGPDRKLYLGLGDGGWANDPHDHGQDLGTLLGSILRFDVKPDGKQPYTVPKDNPFVGRKDARPEIWAYGLRNPWKFDFDDAGRLITGDVGQGDWEEITIVERGQNHGWKLKEGAHCFQQSSCGQPGLIDPVFEYGRDLGQSVTGGYVYRGRTIPDLRGKYLFGDFGSGNLWALTLPTAQKKASAQLLGDTGRAISTFGRDAAGEVYIGDFDGGDVLRLAPIAK